MSQSISNTPVQQVGGLDLLGSTEPRYQVRGRRYTVGSVRPGVASYYDTPRVTLDKSVWDNCFSDSNSSFSKNPQPFNYPNNGNINSDRNNMNNKNSNLNVVDVNMQRRRGFSISGSNSKEMYSSKKHNNNNNNNSSNHNNHGHNGGFNSKRHSHNNKDFNHNSHKSSNNNNHQNSNNNNPTRRHSICVSQVNNMPRRPGRHSIAALNFEKIQVTDVPSFLKAIQLQKYTQSLQDHGVTIEQLLTMTEQDLDRVGVTTIGARRRLLGALCKYNDYLANNWNGSHDDGMSLHSILNDGHSSSNNNNREFGGTHSGFRENKNSSSGRSHNNKGKNRSNSVSSNRLSSTAVMGLMVEDSFHKEDESFYCENTIDSRRRGQSAGYAIGTRFDDANGNNNGSAIVVHNDLPHIKYSNSSHNSPNLSSNINLSLSHRRHSTTELLNNNHSYHSSLHDNIHGAFFEDATTNTTPWALTANSGNGVNDTQAKKDRHLSLKTSHSTNEATLTGFSWNTTSTSKSPTLIGSPHISKQQGPKKQPVEQEQQPPLPSKQSQQVIGGDFLTDMMTSMSISNNSSSPIGDDKLLSSSPDNAQHLINAILGDQHEK